MTIPVYAAGRTESSAPTIRDVGDAVPYEAASTGIRMDGVRSPRRITDKAPQDECPVGLQLVKKVRTDFFDKLRQNRKIKNSILFCDFGRCGG